MGEKRLKFLGVMAGVSLLFAGIMGNVGGLCEVRAETEKHMQMYADMENGTKAAYLKCATYFSDAWPMNFWNSESVHMKEELRQIAADGFNGIILAVPWREFQPKTSPVKYNPYAWEKLDAVMQAAQETGLVVYLRVGYTWDYYDEQESCLERYRDLVTDKTVRSAWIEYAKTLYQAVAKYPNFAGGFMTWEDFWEFTNTNAIDRNSSKGLEVSQKSGYARYAVEQYSLDELSRMYGQTIYGEYRLPLPEQGTGAMRVFFEFYDDFLMQLLKDTQQVFPGLSMEVRADADYLVDADGTGFYYGHSSTYGCEDAAYTAMMYGVPMGFANQGERVSAAEAARMTDQILESVREQAGKPLFLEQFLFVDNTPGFEKNAQVKEAELPAYLSRMAVVLEKYSMGYGIWTYRNYCNNKLYNAQFALGSERWKMNAWAEIVSDNGNKKMHLTEGGMISQSVSGSLEEGKPAYVRFQVESDAPCQITVTLGRETQTVLVDGKQEVCLTFTADSVWYAAWKSDGDVYLDDMNVYTYVQDGMLYEMDGTEGSCIEAVRQLNERLK